MDLHSFQQVLKDESAFYVRQAIERLREGLFDPVAVRLLTAHEEELNAVLDEGFHALEMEKSPHLCVVGAYGQGKSHSLTYIQDRALKDGYVTSMINLDPREIPFYNVAQVYRALMAHLHFPGTEESLSVQWRVWTERRLREHTDPPTEITDLLPVGMPHRFRSVLAGLVQKTLSLTDRQRKAKAHIRYRPREFPYWMARALMGEEISTQRLKNALKYRQVPFYRDAPMTIRDAGPYVQMIEALAVLFRNMGYKGWVLLFDEGESIAQLQTPLRSRSYTVLHSLLAPSTPNKGLYPIFAFTDDFFQRVHDEDYERVRLRNEVEALYFDRNYADAWRDLTIYRLKDLTQVEWINLADRLMRLHMKAYGWQPAEMQTHQAMGERLAELDGHETRFRLKALVDQLDIMHQEQVLG